MTTVSIHQPQYLPYLGFFHKLAHSDIHVFLDTVQLHRRGLQHRNKIKSSTGWQWLTVPISSGSREILSDVKISSTEPWADKHRRAIQLNYARAPYFDALGDDLLGLLQTSWGMLAELNEALIRSVMGVVGIGTSLVRASELGVEGSSTQLLVAVSREVGADRYLSGPGGRNYIEPALFEDAGIDIAWQEFEYPSYDQVFPSAGFIPHLSIIDPLFCAGAEAVSRWVAS